MVSILLLALYGRSLVAGELLTLTIGTTRLSAEWAATPEQRATGLMHRTTLERDHGMLLDFNTPRIAALWMRNTPLALTAAFIDSSGLIVELVEMTPLSDQIHTSSTAVRHALEMERGWFRRHRISPGDRVEGLPE